MVTLQGPFSDFILQMGKLSLVKQTACLNFLLVTGERASAMSSPTLPPTGTMKHHCLQGCHSSGKVLHRPDQHSALSVPLHNTTLNLI